MKKLLLASLVFSVAMTPAFADSSKQSTSSALPKDAKVFLDRYEACWHFAGEFNGDGSDRDRQVNRKMATLRCDIIERDEKAFRKKYATNKKVMAAFTALEAAYSAD